MEDVSHAVILCPGPSLSQPGVRELALQKIYGSSHTVVVNKAMKWAEDNDVPYNAIAALDPLLFGGKLKGADGPDWDDARDSLEPASIAWCPWARLHVLAYSCAIAIVPHWAHKHGVGRQVSGLTFPAESMPHIMHGAERTVFSSQAAVQWLAEVRGVREIFIYGMDVGSTGNTYYDGSDVRWTEQHERWGWERQVYAATVGYVWGKFGCAVHRNEYDAPESVRVVPLDASHKKDA